MTYKPEYLFPGKRKFSPDFYFQGEGVSFFYTYIRKNASTSFKKLFQAMHPGLCPGKLPSIGCMAKHIQVKDVTPEEIDEGFALKIFIYRDPIERVFSVFKNKLIQQDGAEDLLATLEGVVKRDVGLITFDDFVNEYVSLLETERWQDVDGHLYPQVWHLQPVTYNKVIPMGSVYEEMSKILPESLCKKAFSEPQNSTTKGSNQLEGCNVDTPVVYLQRKYSKDKAFPAIDSLLSEATKSRLKEIYADDYRMIECVEDKREQVHFFEKRSSAVRADNVSRLIASLEIKKDAVKEAQKEIEALDKSLEAEKLKADELRGQLELRENENKILKESIRTAKNEVARVKSSTSYQLGYHLVNAAKSRRGALGLPVALYRVVKRRNLSKKASAQRTDLQRVASDQQAVFTPPSEKAAEISILGWPDYPPNGKPYVMGVMDEFTSGCFGEELNLIQPRPDNWFALAEKYRPELIFIESAWKGNNGSWQYRVGDYANKPGQEVAQLCQYAKQKGIPTVFWNKEDPVHHEKFMCSAKLVDYIFTTDADMKASYQAKTGNSNIHALPFAAEPALHKPAPLDGRKPLTCFAGSWYGNRHAERGEAMRWLLQAAKKHGLEIYDRNHGTGAFPFPDEYQTGIKGSLPYKDLCAEYSRYRVFLNVNSVTDSPTMFSRRVFELMACGTPVVSTYAKGIEHLFESDAVWMVKSEQEAEEAIRTLMTNDSEWRRRSLAGIREVFSKHTYAERLNEIFARIGSATRIEVDPSIHLVGRAESKEDLEAFIQFAEDQQYSSFKIGVECPSGLMANASSVPAGIELIKSGGLDQWLVEPARDYTLAGWISATHSYGTYYLQDLANATKYEPEATVWGKSIDRDRFALGGLTEQSACLWKADEFLKRGVNENPLDALESAELYLADTDQFQKGNSRRVRG